ncbi:uncharacterized protein K02A2.6-like isoform X2 [Coccinella septempunctata]|uniref:uncharacterized protein K02A2.6-like isoform X2 n=1 Tax=Coccinella septempunctata TaxID=41139 RepID=UPI001D06CE18|nr:uncharacterized protein K02A2.6-like isoform X2 [Coccinella septempunctata]
MQKDISSSRDTSPNPVSGRVSWIYELNKQELTDELRKLGENVSDSESFEILRRLLIKKWRHLHAGADNVSDSGTEREKHSVPSKLSVRASVRAIMTDNKISFTLNKDNWDVFIERLELYFETQDIDEKKYSAELLTRVCQETYIIFRNLVAPKKTKEFKFGELVKLMKTHLNPTPSEISERNKFYNIKQYPSESISEFVSRLKENSLHCNFKEIETALRDQFVCGLLQPETKIELFRQENLTFQSAVAIAEARESAVKNSLSLKKEETIHFVEKKGFKKHNNFNNKADRNSREREMGQRQFHPERERDGASRRYGDGANREHEDRRGRQNESSVRRRSSGTNGNRSSNVQVTSKNVTCYCCGKRNHFAKDCRYRYKSCNYCHTKGNEKVDEVYNNDDSNDEYDFYYLNKNERKNVSISTISNITADPLVFDVEIENEIVKMELDTGSYVSVISEFTFRKCFPNKQMVPPRMNLTTYDHSKLAIKGIISDLKVKFNNCYYKLEAYILPGNGKNLIGRQWFKVFGMWPLQLPSANSVNNLQCEHANLMKYFSSKYPLLFSDKQGNFSGRKIQLKLKENFKPVQCKPYRVPFALKSKVSTEIKRLVEIGNLEPVTISEWATPVVPVIKGDGVRLCGNFKITVNPQLIIKQHPIPLKEKVFQTLKVGKKWSQIDLKHAFMQFEIAEESRDPLTIITEDGLFRYRKLPEGIASSPAECQDILTDILKGIDNTEVYIDNIYCTGRTDKEHLLTLEKIFFKLNEYDLRVNIKKCELFKEKIEILGYLLDQEGLKP